jgi:hypothetical protein
MAKTTGNLSIPVLLGLKGKGLDEAIKDTKRLSNQLGRLSDTAVKAAAGFAAFKGGQLVANFARDAIDAGRDLQVNLNGLQSVFGDLTPDMVAFTKTTASIGLSMSEAAKASTFLGSVLKQSGFSMDEVSVQTKRLVGLAADLSLTFGYDVQESLLAMTALFRGEYDPIEKFGVAMKQNEIEGVKLARGLEGLTGSAERLVDQQIRLELLYQRSADSLGAYERQAGTLRVAQDTLRATFANMQQIIGTQMLPVVADLTASLIPLVETVGPILAAAMQQVIPLLVAFAQNTDQIVGFTINLVKGIAALVTIIATLAKWIVENIGWLKVLVVGLAAVFSGLYALRIGIVIFTGLRSVTQALNVTLGLTAVQIRIVGLALAALPIIGWIAALGTLVGIGYQLSESAKAAGDSVENMLDEKALLADIEELKNLNTEITASAEGFENVEGAAGNATNAVADFYQKLGNEIEKQQAKLRLQQLGASEGLISAILGSGEDWQRVFNDVVSRGIAGVADVQKLFRATAAGFDEAMQQWEEEYGEPFRQFKEDALAARDALIEFTREIEILPSVAETLGEFEQSAVDNLASIEEKLQEAFDNKQLLDGSYENLLQYARDEFQVLRQIERQRDEIIGRRDAAEALINSVQRSIQSAGNLVNILGRVQDGAEGVDVVEFATRTVSAGTSLKEFRTALLYNFVEPIEKAKSRADELVSGYRAVVERTREFVDNLKALRALGLDPMLFNQLVEAGVEAGGETARALVEGGADTVNEVNSLFKELDSLGMELGENTAQVMYGQGENFVNGIVAGLEAQAGELEISAQSIAEAFTTTFEQVLIDGINAAIDAAEAALARMPRIEDFVGDLNFGDVSDDDGDGPDGGRTSGGAGITAAIMASATSVEAARLAAQQRLSIGQYNPLQNYVTPQPLQPFQPYGLGFAGGGDPTSPTSIVNIYTQSSTRETANALNQLNRTTGSSRTTTGVRSLSDFSVR